MGHIKRSKLEMIKKWAILTHESVNQKYGNYPYSKHLNMVYSFAEKYSIYYIDWKKIPTVLAGAMTHDIIEDAMQTYNDVKRYCGEEVAELAYALTNEKGKNRAERANNKYYDEMRNVEHAPYIKICDRLANASNSLKENSSMLKKYRKEHSSFKLSVAESNNKFINWIFKRNITRQNFPRLAEKLIYKNLKYKLMWQELDKILE